MMLGEDDNALETKAKNRPPSPDEDSSENSNF